MPDFKLKYVKMLNYVRMMFLKGVIIVTFQVMNHPMLRDLLMNFVRKRIQTMMMVLLGPIIVISDDESSHIETPGNIQT